MKALVYEAPNTVRVKDRETPQAEQGWAIVKIKYAGLCGGDLNILAGTHPRAKAPLIMGHECVGVLDSDNVDSMPKGTRVTFSPLITCGKCTPCKTGNSHVCNTLRLFGIDRDGAFAEYAKVPEENLIPVPDHIPDKLAALVEPVAVAVHTLRDTNFLPGDNALVIGGGAIGLCLALTLRVFGASSILIMETDEKRANIARNMGFEVVDTSTISVEEYCKGRTGGDGYDWVFDCAGVQAVAEVLLDAVKVRGTIVVVAGYKKPPSMPLIKGMFKEPTIKFVRVYRTKDLEIAVDIVAKDPDFEKIITHVLPLSEGERAFDLIKTPSTGAVKVLFECF